MHNILISWILGAITVLLLDQSATSLNQTIDYVPVTYITVCPHEIVDTPTGTIAKPTEQCYE